MNTTGTSPRYKADDPLAIYIPKAWCRWVHLNEVRNVWQFISENPRCSNAEIAKHVGIPYQCARSIVTRLLNGGYISTFEESRHRIIVVNIPLYPAASVQFVKVPAEEYSDLVRQVKGE